MNEQIYYFAEQAAEHALLNPSEENLQSEAEGYDTIIVSRAFIDKFVNLIVEECCEVLINEGNKWHEFAKNPPEGQGNVASAALFAAFRLKEDAVDAVQEHFGVNGMSTEDKKNLIKELLGVKND